MTVAHSELLVLYSQEVTETVYPCHQEHLAGIHKDISDSASEFRLPGITGPYNYCTTVRAPFFARYPPESQ